ncbi:hypothetical protein P0L94_17685 [Microbacter sp. GSS18]|nr:hypothetical protein P0L94_17685 [Microbacter sp. GSS18]
MATSSSPRRMQWSGAVGRDRRYRTSARPPRRLTDAGRTGIRRHRFVMPRRDARA